jgi:hypothetical protein
MVKNYAASELRSLLEEAGFSPVEIYGGWDKAPYDHRAAALIAAARKGGTGEVLTEIS